MRSLSDFGRYYALDRKAAWLSRLWEWPLANGILLIGAVIWWWPPVTGAAIGTGIGVALIAVGLLLRRGLRSRLTRFEAGKREILEGRVAQRRERRARGSPD